MNLGDYLLTLQNNRREPGVHDCATVPADWCIALGLPDPIMAWRGSYDTEEGAQEIISDAGGLDAIFAAGFASAGVAAREGDPQEGDVGVIRMAGHEASSVFTGRRWVFVGARGIGFATISPEHVVAVWAVADHG